jgi:hypothetical protein
MRATSFVACVLCAPPAANANRIVRENLLPGSASTEWDINGAGDASIQGFATDMSVGAGGVVELKVDTDAEAWRVDIYRLGWYGGKGARLVDSVAPLRQGRQPRQPACAFEASTLLVDCANWSISARWRVPAAAVSGIHIARLVRTDEPDAARRESGGGGGAWRVDHSPVRADPRFARAGVDSTRTTPEGSMATHAYGAAGHGRALGRARFALREPRASHVYFIVRDDDMTSAVLVQTMDPTWQAYNCWGTTNTYGVACSDPLAHAGSPAPPDTSRRAYKASYNRPFATRAYRASNMPFSACDAA